MTKADLAENMRNAIGYDYDPNYMTKLEPAIKKYARLIAGKNLDIIADLEQIGRIKAMALAKEYDLTRDRNIAFAKTSIRHDMTRYIREDTVVRIPLTTARINGIRCQSEEVSETIPEKPTDTRKQEAMSDLLGQIEAEISMLPSDAMESARAYFAKKEFGSEKVPGSHGRPALTTAEKRGKPILKKLIRKYRKQASALLAPQ